MLTAQPVEIAASDEAHGGIQFNFANAFSIVEPAAEDDCRLSDRERPAEADPTRRRVGNLAIPAGTIDLTVPIGSDPELPVTVEEERPEVVLGFDGSFEVGKEEYVSAYLLVAPGSHAAGSVRLG